MKRWTYPVSILSVAAVFGLSSFAGSRIYFDLDKATAVMTAEMRYFGDIRPEILEKATQIIAQQWEGKPTRPGDTEVYPLYLIFKGQIRLSTDFRTSYSPSIEQAYAEAQANREIAKNFIRVEQNSKTGSSMMSLAGNVGAFLYDDHLAESVTVAHEFGHSLGLQHFGSVAGMQGFPPIMLERGAAPGDPQYAYDPSKPFSPVNPIYRRVRQEDLYKLDVNNAPVFEEDDPKRLQSTSVVKVVYEKGSKTKGYIDVGYWSVIDKKNLKFKPGKGF